VDRTQGRPGLKCGRRTRVCVRGHVGKEAAVNKQRTARIQGSKRGKEKNWRNKTRLKKKKKRKNRKGTEERPGRKKKKSNKSETDGRKKLRARNQKERRGRGRKNRGKHTA